MYRKEYANLQIEWKKNKKENSLNHDPLPTFAQFVYYKQNPKGDDESPKTKKRLSGSNTKTVDGSDLEKGSINQDGDNFEEESYDFQNTTRTSVSENNKNISIYSIRNSQATTLEVFEFIFFFLFYVIFCKILRCLEEGKKKWR
jgi:hypothetical protein